ncbi:MAG: UDP-N-acetylmuramoyl-tripeptide--D-alanyl-D-alanine ligase [Lentihominibacter sp.]|jgi:UDP-N-acetylmuramoyl-tripeptide--D-alanyl-D-alanine ligase
MIKMTIETILNATGGKLIQECEEKEIRKVVQDSRHAETGAMFVAIIGENQNGHKYIPSVAEAGCSTVMVSEAEGEWREALRTGAKSVNLILVEDTEYALGELARNYLKELNVRRVAVTGSVGKTTVRDMIYYVLSEKYNCGRNMKNYNNLIGLPISVLSFDDNTEAVVLEMGMDRFGEIERLGEIVNPETAVITNIGVAHIERLGSREGIFRAKMEIADNIVTASEGGSLVYAADGEYLTEERTAGDYRQISVGKDGHSKYIISDVDDFGIEGIEFTVEFNEQIQRIKLPVSGAHNAVNATLAIAAGATLGVDMDTAVKGLAKVELTGSRLKVLNGRVTIIDDSYNANPDSMKSGLRVLASSKSAGRKTAILGDMYELGEESRSGHFDVGLFAGGCGIDQVVTIGESAAAIAEGAKGGSAIVKHYPDKESFFEEAGSFIGEGDLVLVKASRGMHMEEVVEWIQSI